MRENNFRKIAFRAWDKILKIMWEVVNLNYHWWYVEMNYQRWGSSWAFDDYELMQYTGLKDKNGKEIYEGDIVKYKEYIEKVEYIDYWFFPFAEEYHELSFFYAKHSSLFEVIWNIYETPELLYVWPPKLVFKEWFSSEHYITTETITNQD